MKIVYDHQIFSWRQYGGVARYFYEIAREIARMPECEVEIFAPLYANRYFRDDDNLLPIGIKSSQFPGSGRIASLINSTASRLLLKPRRDVDIFHETYYSQADCCPRTAKRVITVYDMIHEKFSGSGSPRDNTQQIKALAVRRADQVICISQNTRRDLIEILHVPEEKISVVYLGYSLAATEAGTKAAVERKPFLLFVGHRDGYKNFDCLQRAYARSSLLKSEFSLVCFGGGKITGREAALMQSLGVPSERIVHMSGPDDVLAGLYASATAFVYPSLYEGFGIPPLEAMSFDCPVVCSNTSSLPEVVGDAAELFDPADDADLRAAIERVVSVPENAARLVAKGRERVRNFSWEKCARDTLGVYAKVLRR